MKIEQPIELPCDIVKDLLPSYVDGLTSPASSEAVKNHLDGCGKCSKLYSDMKSEYSSKDHVTDTLQSTHNDADKKLFQKINRRFSKKLRITIALCIAAIILVTAGWEFLYNEPFRTVSPDDVSVSVENYYIKELVNDGETPDSDSEKYSVTIYSDEDDAKNAEDFVNITIPDDFTVSLSRETLDRTEYVSLIKFSSTYPLRSILWNYVEENGENVLVITGFRTTFLYAKSDSPLGTQCSIDFRKTDKVVYREKDGTETVLWEEK